MMAATACSPGNPCQDDPLDMQCSRVNNVSRLASLYHPDRLFDPRSTPTIHLGSLSVPGPLLPLAISVFFVFHQLRRLRARRAHGNRIAVEGLPPTPRQNSLEWPDPGHPDAPRIYLAKANLLFHGTITNGAILHFGRSFLQNETLCCVEVAALLLYADIFKPEVRRSCLAAALGWTLFALLDRLADDIATVATWLVVVLAAPLAWQIDGRRGDVEIQQSSSGYLLMLMATNRLVFDTQVASQQWANDHPAEACKYLAVLFVGNGLMTYVFNRRRRANVQQTHWNLQQTFATLNLWTPFVFDASMLVAAFIGNFLGGIVCTAYLSSCLPWSGLMFGKCASSPSVSQFSLVAGYSIYSIIFLIVIWNRPRRGERHAGQAPTVFLWAKLETSANVVGWACLFLNILYVALGLLL